MGEVCADLRRRFERVRLLVRDSLRTHHEIVASANRTREGSQRLRREVTEGLAECGPRGG